MLENMTLVIVQETIGMCKRCRGYTRSAYTIIFAQKPATQRHSMNYNIHAILLTLYLIKIYPNTYIDARPIEQRKNKRNGIAVDGRTAQATHELFYHKGKCGGRVSSFHFIFDLSNNFICYYCYYHHHIHETIYTQ